MRFFKLAFFSAFILFFLVTAIGLLFPSSIRVSRAININATPEKVYRLTADIKYWKLWMDGAKQNTIQFLSARTEGVGTVFKLGTNVVSVITADANKIEIEWKSETGTLQTSVFNLIPNGAQDVTTVQWYFEQHLKWYPWERFGSMTNDKMLAPPMEKSLTNLKELVEDEKQQFNENN